MYTFVVNAEPVLILSSEISFPLIGPMANPCAALQPTKEEST